MMTKAKREQLIREVKAVLKDKKHANRTDPLPRAVYLALLDATVREMVKKPRR